MATGALIPNGETQFFDLTGAPLAGGLVHTYAPGTTTPKTTWVDQAETTANTNPIVLDSLGRCIIWGSGTYRQFVTDAAGNEIWDQITSDGGLSSVQGEIDTLNSEVATLNTEVADLQAAINLAPKWFHRTFVLSGTTYSAVNTDSGTLFFTGVSSGSITLTLPNTTTLSVGWYAGFVRQTQDLILEVEGSHSEKILLPPDQINTGLNKALGAQPFENLIIHFDGTNFEVLSASPFTWTILGASTGFSVPNSPLLGGNGSALVSVAVGSGLSLSGGTLSAAGGTPHMAGIPTGTFTIPAPNLRITQQGGGGGGGATGPSQSGGAGGGGQGAFIITVLTGLTVGFTLTINVGAGGTGGAAGTGNNGVAGGDTTVSSGTQSISTITAGGGSPGLGTGVSGGLGGVASGGSFNANGNRGRNGDLVTFGAGAPGSYGRFGAGGDGSENIGQNGGDGILGFVLVEWFT